MALGLMHQYEWCGYLAARLNHHWHALFNPKGNRSDQQRLAAIEQYGAEVETFSDSKLRAEFESLRKTIDHVDLVRSLDALVVPVFTLVREASRRTCGLFPYPEQILAGLAMVRGGIAEMATGEGKTLAAILPASLFALAGKGVHVITVNNLLGRAGSRIHPACFWIARPHLRSFTCRPGENSRETRCLPQGHHIWRGLRIRF